MPSLRRHKMPLERPSWAKAGGSGGPEKRRAVGDGEKLKDLLEGGQDNMQRIVKLLLRMSVINAQGLREATTFIIKTDNPVMVRRSRQEASTTTRQSRSRRPTRRTRRHRKKELESLGPPFLHVWISVLEVLIQASQTPREIREALEKYWKEQVMKVTVLELADKVRVCMVRKTYEKGTKKLHVRFDDTLMEHAVVKAIVSNGGTINIGAAPRSALEREAQ